LELQTIIDAEVQADPNKLYTYRNFLDNIDHSVSGGAPPRRGNPPPAENPSTPGSPPGPGNQTVVGIAELMQDRISFLNSLPEFQTTTPTFSNISKIPSPVTPYTEIRLNAELINADLVVLAWRSGTSERFDKTTMYDDGNHNDGEAGDGLYGITIKVGATDLQYYLRAENSEAVKFYPQRAEYEFLTLPVESGSFVINEFMADNDAVIADQDGEFDDWIELYNKSDKAIPLDGYHLSDDGKDLTQWAFPDTSIAAGAYLIIWTDGDEIQSGLHANFKLSKSGETIYLVNSDTSIIDQIAFGAQKTDLSTGRYPNGAGNFVETNPTFATENQIPTTAIEDHSPPIPATFTLKQNYPNPFNPSTIIRFDIQDRTLVNLVIYDVLGKSIKTLVNQPMPSGINTVSWEGNDESGKPVGAGVYLYRITAGEYTQSRKMLLLR